jgi:putative ABC transport system permease protein
VNGKQFAVGGILEGVTGPGGRDGYVHIEDAANLLRMEEMEISEVAVRLRDFSRLRSVFADLEGRLGQEKNPAGKPALEVHTWETLSPFYNIARMIDLMTVFIKIMLVAIVLVSIVLKLSKITFDFGRETGLLLTARLNPADLLAVAGIVIVVAVVASLQPSFKAARMDSITALGHV